MGNIIPINRFVSERIFLLFKKSFINNIPEENNKGKINFEGICSVFGCELQHNTIDFLDKFLSNQSYQLENESSNLPIISADIAAGHILSLIKKGWVKEIDFIKLCINACAYIVKELGYTEIELNESRGLVENGCNIIYAAGCQNREFLASRGLVLADLYYFMQKYNIPVFMVVLGGKRPPGDEKIIFEPEWKYIKKFFDQRLLVLNQNDGSNVIDYPKIKHEGESLNTTENINKLLDLINSSCKNKKINIFVTGSTFHLIRLSQAIEKTYTDNKYSFEIKNIILVGAESEFSFDVNDNYIKKIIGDTILDRRYEKQILFEIYRFLFSNKNYREKMFSNK